jgi:hypothetical protein
MQSHTGKTLAKALHKMLIEHGLEQKVNSLKHYIDYSIDTATRILDSGPEW